MTQSPQELRLDLCLYNLRFCKTRKQAQTLIEKGRVRVNGTRTQKSARKIRPGDHLEFRTPQGEQFITIIALSEKRLGAPLASEHYQLTQKPT